MLVNQKKRLEILLTGLLIIISISGQQNCNIRSLLRSISPNSTKIAFLQTGSVQVVSKQPEERYNWFTITFSDKHPLQKLNVALNPAYIRGYQNQVSVSFSIRYVVKDTYIKCLFVLGNSTNWISTHVHYIISSRDDIICGQFIANQNQLIEPTAGKKKKVTITQLLLRTNLNQKQALNTVVKVLAFINGLKTQQSNFTIQIDDPTFITRQKKLNVPVQITNSVQPIQFLSISYFGYAINSNLSTNGFFNFKYVNSIVNKKNLEQSAIVGMSGFNGTALTELNALNKNKYYIAKIPRRLLQGGFSVEKSSQISDGQIFIYKKVFQIQQLDVVSRQFLKPLFLSPNKTLDMNVRGIIQVQNNTCITFQRCNDLNGYISQENNDQKRQSRQTSCIICKSNKVYNAQQNKCVCKPNFVTYGEQCIAVEKYCGPKSIYQQGQCYEATKSLLNPCKIDKNQKFVETNGNCICQDEYQLFSYNQISFCRVKCPINSKYSDIIQEDDKINFECQCIQGYKFDEKSKLCTPCTIQQQWDPKQRKCVCKQNYFKQANGQCVLCSPKATYNKLKNLCECWPGWTGSGLVCQQAIGVRRREKLTIYPTDAK